MSGEAAVGHALRLLRERAEIAQRELARRAGTSAGMISSYELGKSDPGAGTLERLLRAMGYSFRDLDTALRQVRGEEIPMESGAPNGTPAPRWEEGLGVLREEEVTREVDRRVARMYAEAEARRRELESESQPRRNGA